MDFVEVMLFTQQDFHLDVYFSFDSFCYLRLLLFPIKFQPGVVYKSVVYKKSMFKLSEHYAGGKTGKKYYTVFQSLYQAILTFSEGSIQITL